MILLILFWVITLLLLSWAIWARTTDHEDQAIGAWIVTSTALITMLITTISIPLSNQSELQRMQAFCESNAENYRITATKTELILSEQKFIAQALIPVEGSIEKFKLGDEAAKRLVEWRNEVVRYNEGLARYRFFSNHPLVGFYYPDPGSLKYIIIK